MIGLLLLQAGVTAIIYCFFFARPWFLAWRRTDISKEARPSYFIGFLFATFFYYGAPIWIWRYGWKITAIILLACIVAIFVMVKLTSLALQFDNMGQNFIAGIILQVPVRVAVGRWLAKYDIKLKSKALNA